MNIGTKSDEIFINVFLLFLMKFSLQIQNIVKSHRRVIDIKFSKKILIQLKLMKFDISIKPNLFDTPSKKFLIKTYENKFIEN